MQFIFEPNVGQTAAIRPTTFNPNSVIPISGQVNTNPVNISPFFAGEQNRRAEEQLDLSKRRQAVSEQRFARQIQAEDRNVALNLFKDLDTSFKTAARRGVKETQSNILNTESGLDLRSSRQSELHFQFMQDQQNLQNQLNGLIGETDLINGLSPERSVRLRQEFTKLNNDFRNKWNNNKEYQEFRQANAGLLNLQSQMQKAKKGFDYDNASKLERRYMAAAQIDGDYSDEIINAGIPSQGEVSAALSEFDSCLLYTSDAADE